MLSRRTLLASSIALLAPAAAAQSAFTDRAAVVSSLRILRVRHRTTLVELGAPNGDERDGRRRALVDPCFTAGLGAGVLFRAGEPALVPEEAGEVDLLLVSVGSPGTELEFAL